MEPEFNLLDEPWILALDADGGTSELSLKEIFSRAHSLSALAGELPTQDAAVLRLLLSVLYAVFTRSDEGGAPAPVEDYRTALDRWRALWDAGRFPEAVVGDYLETYRDRFYLFHPTRPFYQVRFDEPPVTRDGVTLKPTLCGAEKLVGDIASSGNKPQLFLARSDKSRLSFNEAARWLLHLNAFDVSPAGAPGHKEKTVKGFGHPWPADIGLIWVGGNNLFETLMLNLVLYDPKTPESWADTLTPWEDDRFCQTGDDLWKTETSQPRNPLALYSMQFRRVALLRDGGHVSGYELWSGLTFDHAQVFAEQMTAWRVNKDDPTVVYPRRHNASRQMWRDFSALVPVGAAMEPPGIAKWISELDDQGVALPFLRLGIASVEYTKDTAVSDVFSDQLRLNAALLSAKSEAWQLKVSDLLKATDDCVILLGYLAAELAEATGDKEGGKGRRDAAKDEAYFRLDEPFRAWLAAIDPRVDKKEDKGLMWMATMKDVVRALGADLVGAAGDGAFIGRTVKKGNRAELIAAPKSYAKFLRGVQKILDR